MGYPPAVMRRRTVVAVAALIAAFALAGLPVPAGSRTLSTDRNLDQAAFTSVTIPADAAALSAPGALDAAAEAPGHIAPDDAFLEPGAAPDSPTARPRVHQPGSEAGSAWKDPKRTITGFATFYDNGTTAMRLPRGTVVRICGDGGCIQRMVTDYGPQKPSRIVDLYRPDFFKICGCPSWSGTTKVTVSIY
jgi:hypothetical protein